MRPYVPRQGLLKPFGLPPTSCRTRHDSPQAAPTVRTSRLCRAGAHRFPGFLEKIISSGGKGKASSDRPSDQAARDASTLAWPPPPPAPLPAPAPCCPCSMLPLPATPVPPKHVYHTQFYRTAAKIPSHSLFTPPRFGLGGYLQPPSCSSSSLLLPRTSTRAAAAATATARRTTSPAACGATRAITGTTTALAAEARPPGTWW